MPVIAPVEVFRVSPAGNAPVAITYVYGGNPPDAATEELYATPTCAVLAGTDRMRGVPTAADAQVAKRKKMITRTSIRRNLLSDVKIQYTRAADMQLQLLTDANCVPR
jgi:hypothetical protein